MKIIRWILCPFRRIAKWFIEHYGGKIYHIDKNGNEKGDP